MAAKPRAAKDDVTAPTSSEDSFSLSSEDHLADSRFGGDDPHDTPHEARAKSCSPCRLWGGQRRVHPATFRRGSGSPAAEAGQQQPVDRQPEQQWQHQRWIRRQ